MGLRAWRLGWVLGCLGVSLLLLSGCDTGREADSRLSRVQVVLDTRAFTRRTPWSLDAQGASQTRQLVRQSGDGAGFLHTSPIRLSIAVGRHRYRFVGSRTIVVISVIFAVHKWIFSRSMSHV